MSTKLGVLFVGVNGSVATTSIVSAKAVAAGLSKEYGLYTSTLMSKVKDGKLERYNQKPIKEILDLIGYDQVVFGGWDIENERENTFNYARELGIVPKEVVDSLRNELIYIKAMPGFYSEEFIKNLQGLYILKQPTLKEKVQQLKNDITSFQKNHQLNQCVVINVSSTEAFHAPERMHQDLAQFEHEIAMNSSIIGPAQIYAYAALSCGAAYVNFTPSLAEDIPAIQELAKKVKRPIAGKDGKTGQTLMKTALAPVFRLKNLHVEGWFSTNILGNKDGLVLDEPGSLKSKIVTKSGVLNGILGYEPYHKVNINYYPPRGDDKEAWDNIDFKGILGMPMQLKINFLCRDSILAAGSILDLIRFMEYCLRQGEVGIQEQLSFFFKSPTLSDKSRQPIHDFFKQEGMLKDWLREKAFGVSYIAK